MPYDACVIVGKFLKICCAVCKSSSNTVVETCVVACHVKNFEEQLIVSLYGLLKVPILIHLVETQMQMLLGLHAKHIGKETVVWLIRAWKNDKSL